MKRDIIQLFIDWKNRGNRKPLIVRGAKHVGKTFTINEFAKQQFANFVAIHPEDSIELFTALYDQSVIQAADLINIS